MANCLSSLMRDPGNSIIKQRSVYTLNTSCGSREGKLEEICQGTPSFQLAKSRRRIGGLSKLLLGFQVFTENWLVTLPKKKRGGGKGARKQLLCLYSHQFAVAYWQFKNWYGKVFIKSSVINKKHKWNCQCEPCYFYTIWWWL